MNNDGKLYITISDTRPTTNGEPVTGGNIGEAEKSNKDEKQSLLLHSFFNFVEQQAKTMYNYTIGNVGNFTGDFQSQREISMLAKVMGHFTGLATAVKVGGAWGGIAYAVASTINYGLEERSNYLANRNQNYKIDQLREISGLNGLTNGSR